MENDPDRLGPAVERVLGGERAADLLPAGVGGDAQFLSAPGEEPEAAFQVLPRPVGRPPRPLQLPCDLLLLREFTALQIAVAALVGEDPVEPHARQPLKPLLGLAQGGLLPLQVSFRLGRPALQRAAEVRARDGEQVRIDPNASSASASRASTLARDMPSFVHRSDESEQW